MKIIGPYSASQFSSSTGANSQNRSVGAVGQTADAISRSGNPENHSPEVVGTRSNEVDWREKWTVALEAHAERLAQQWTAGHERATERLQDLADYAKENGYDRVAEVYDALSRRADARFDYRMELLAETTDARVGFLRSGEPLTTELVESRVAQLEERADWLRARAETVPEALRDGAAALRERGHEGVAKNLEKYADLGESVLLDRAEWAESRAAHLYGLVDKLA